MWIVTWEERVVGGTWVAHVNPYNRRRLAQAMYDCLIPGPNGSFGPIEYRNITLAKVVASCDG